MRIAAAGAVAALAGLLAACGGAPPAGHQGAGPDLGQTLAAIPAAAVDDRRKGGAPATAPGEMVLITPPAEAVTPKLQSLIAKSDLELAKALGTPDFRRTDGDAQIWQYRSSACILDAFLYRVADGVRVRHVETRGLNVRRLDPDACFMDFLSARAAGARPAAEPGAPGAAASPAPPPPPAGGAAR